MTGARSPVAPRAMGSEEQSMVKPVTANGGQDWPREPACPASSPRPCRTARDDWGDNRTGRNLWTRILLDSLSWPLNPAKSASSSQDDSFPGRRRLPAHDPRAARGC